MSSHTHLGRVASCTLAACIRQDGTPKKPDFAGRCHRICCFACNHYDARRWVRRHSLKGSTIRDKGTHFVLSWRNLVVEAKSKESILPFFRAVGALAHEIESGCYKSISGYVLYAEFNIEVRRGKLMIQPHVHLFTLGNPLQMWGIGKWWRNRGGRKMYMVERSLDTIIGYAATRKKSMKMRSDAARWKIANDVLLEPVENELGKCAAVRRLGGPALNRHGFSRIRARSRAEDLSKRLDPDDPDRRWKGYCPDVRAVCFCERCPHCLNCERDSIRPNGHTPSGKQRFRCQKCKKSWNEKPVSSRKSGPICGKRMQIKVTKLRREGNSIRKIAAALNTTRYTVAKALSFHR